MKYPTLLVFSLMLLPTVSHAYTLPPCAKQAAADFKVPPKIFAAIIIHTQRQPVTINDSTGKSGEFGPMKLTQKAIEAAAPEIGRDVETIKQNACANYRAAAWWLREPSDAKKNRDVWSAVSRYFYHTRPNNKDGFGAINSVKMIYAKL